MKLFRVTLIVGVIMISPHLVWGQCPPGCTCQGTIFKCLGTRMRTIPNIPRTTAILDLKFNSIEEVFPGSFRGLTNLHTIFLNGNNITHLDDDTFEGLNHLRILHLDRNQISYISDTAFRGLHQLQDLFLSYNEIDSLEEGVFSDLSSLERLYMNNNLLESLPESILEDIPHLKRVGLDGNPILCDCSMTWLVQYTRENKLMSPVICSQPPSVSGRPAVPIVRSLSCSKPEIVANGHDVEVKPGETASFPCKTKGEPAPSTQWLLNNKIVDPEADERFEFLEDGSLLIHGVLKDVAGFYKCVARNSLGKAESEPVELRLLDATRSTPPRILAKPEDRAVVENGATSLTCVGSGFPPPEVRWTINDRPLPLDPRFQWDSNTGILTLTNLKAIDQGMYRCVAVNSLGTASEFARLQVFTAPTFITKPQNQKVVERHSVFFSCDVTADPPATITWQKNDVELHNSDRISINPSGSTLTISLVEKLDEGTYQCTADNLGGVAKASAKLTVSSIAPPKIFRPPSDISALIGSTVKFDCVVSGGDPIPMVRWEKDNYHLSLTSNEKYEVTASGSLIISEVEYSDEGTYECSAENLAGVEQAFAVLTIRDPRFQPITQQHISRTVSNADRQVNRAIDNTRRDLYELRHRPKNAQDLLRANRYPSTRALSLSRAAEIFEQTLEQLYREIHEGSYFNITPTLNITYEELLTQSQLALISSLSGCQEHRRIVENCDDLCFHRKYRSFDGTCNNFQNTMYGSSLSPLSRIRTPRYENNFNLPIGWDPKKLHNGYSIPSARKISLKLISTVNITPDTQYTHMLMQWGQFLDHDLDFVPTAASNARFSDGRFCNETCNSQSPCFPIPVATDDPRVRKQRCIGFVRSSSMCGSGMTSAIFGGNILHRQQLNMLTSFIDASNVYGSSEEDAFNLRDHTSNGGLLRVGVYSSYAYDKRLLPPNQGEFVDCQVDPNTAHVPCFQAGDHRANEQLGLLTMHTLWFREHNRLASELQRMNSHWNSDITYHETRKIIGAVMQHITYEHWLPKVLGSRGMQLIGRYRGYDSSVDPSILNEFASAAFRFGHTLINPVLSRLNESFQPIKEGNLPLHKAFFAPFRLIEEGGVDPLLRGLFGVAAKKLVPGEFLNSELTERLFVMANEVAQDLAAVNIQRGRDHGLQSYNSYREHCGLFKARTFDDLRREISDYQVRRKLEELYGHPDNIDLFAGGVSEDVIEGARIGPTFVCIIAEQFKRLRDGDRFWYENPGVFSEAQLNEIKRVTLSRIICDNSDKINDVQKDVFLLARDMGEYLRCESKDIPKMDIKAWSQCCEDCSRSGDFRSIRSKRSVEESFPVESKEESNQEVGESFNEKFAELEELIALLRRQIYHLEDEIAILKKN